MSRFAHFVRLTVVGVVLVGCGTAQSGSHPAATVNGHDISMTAYSKQVSYKCALTASNFQGANICGGKSDPLGLRSQLQKTALNNLIDEELVREYAQKNNIAVSQQDFNNEWNIVYNKKFHRNMPALKAYARQVGLTVSDVRVLVRQDMLQQRVLGVITQNMPLRVPATLEGRMVVGSLKQASAVQKDLNHGIPFLRIQRALATRFKNLCATVSCGDRLWAPNAFIPANQSRVATAPSNSRVGPFSLQNGLLLILVEGHSQTYPLTSSQEYSLRQQLFAQWVTHQAQRANVHRYVAT